MDSTVYTRCDSGTQSILAAGRVNGAFGDILGVRLLLIRFIRCRRENIENNAGRTTRLPASRSEGVVHR